MILLGLLGSLILCESMLERIDLEKKSVPLSLLMLILRVRKVRDSCLRGSMLTSFLFW